MVSQREKCSCCAQHIRSYLFPLGPSGAPGRTFAGMEPTLPFTRTRITLLFVLAASVGLSLSLIAGRVVVTHQIRFLFLAWNLFLALIPYALSTLLGLARGPLQARLLLPVGAAWLLFFPNAPYLVTDLFHLDERPDAPLWFDLALILSCAWNGLMLAYASLADMQTLVRLRLGPPLPHVGAKRSKPLCPCA